MSKYYRVRITKTARREGRNGEFETYDHESKDFKTLKEAREYLEENYSGHKKVKMFRDLPNGDIAEVGWIYSFKTNGWGDDADKWWTEQHWTELSEVKERSIIKC